MTADRGSMSTPASMKSSPGTSSHRVFISTGVSMVMGCVKTSNPTPTEMIKDPAMARMAVKALTRGKRLVRKIIMTKAMAGNTGINQDKLTMAFVSPTFYCSLPLQPIQVINIRSQTLTVDVEDEGQTNRHF